jgi:hypothetical protein
MIRILAEARSSGGSAFLALMMAFGNATYSPAA